MPNTSTPPGGEPLSAPVAFVTTSNLHLATLLATVGAKPLQIIKDGGVTPTGDRLTKWVFESDALSDEVMSLWQNPGKFRRGQDIQPVRDWEQMSHEERAMAINVVAAFTANLRHFITSIKGGK